MNWHCFTVISNSSINELTVIDIISLYINNIKPMLRYLNNKLYGFSI